jgi:hypothetical protein
VHQRVLRSFAATGHPPVTAALTAAAAAHGRTAAAVLADLHAEDFLRLDAAGQIRVAYPFSAAPTPHLVHLDGGPQVHAMCAIDALGTAAMPGVGVTIVSADPRTGEPVTVTVEPGGQTAAWEPVSAVVFAGQQDSCCACPPDATGKPAGPVAADVSCGYVNFFAARASAAAWAGARTGITGQVLGQAVALRLGGQTFGPLLAASYGASRGMGQARRWLVGRVRRHRQLSGSSSRG